MIFRSKIRGILTHNSTIPVAVLMVAGVDSDYCFYLLPRSVDVLFPVVVLANTSA